MSSQKTLPVELLAAIVNEHAEHSDTLQSCSLVSHLFRDLCQKFLFQSIEIVVKEEYQHTFGRLRDVIRSNSKIGSFVESLRIVFCDQSQVPPSFAELLDLLPAVHKLTLDMERGPDLTWEGIAMTAKTPLLQLMKRPCLESLCLRYIDVPPETIAMLPQLKHLNLNRYLNPYNRYPPQRQLSFPDEPKAQHGYLESLSVADTEECSLVMSAFNHESSALSLSRLKSFHGQVFDNRQAKAFASVLAVTCNTLTSITIKLHGSPFLSEPVLSLNKLPSLLSLEIRVFDSNPRDHTVKEILRLLKSIQPTNHITRISLTSLSPLFRKTNWTDVDELLNDKGHFPALCLVNFAYPGASNDIAGILPKLSSSRILSVWSPTNAYFK
ncbi:hypothetical protein H0H92_015723 [Tricholoma furcatifolium]|nr:hypothetical protein H0H92_015723 [Tricholoma furcatifolium]